MSRELQAVCCQTVSSGAAQEGSGCNNTASNQLGIPADLTAPAVVPTTPSLTTNGVFSVRATFSESVTSFSVVSLSVTNGAASNLAGSGAVCNFDIMPTADEALGVIEMQRFSVPPTLSLA